MPGYFGLSLKRFINSWCYKNIVCYFCIFIIIYWKCTIYALMLLCIYLPKVCIRKVVMICLHQELLKSHKYLIFKNIIIACSWLCSLRNGFDEAGPARPSLVQHPPIPPTLEQMNYTPQNWCLWVKVLNSGPERKLCHYVPNQTNIPNSLRHTENGLKTVWISQLPELNEMGNGCGKLFKEKIVVGDERGEGVVLSLSPTH